MGVSCQLYALAALFVGKVTCLLLRSYLVGQSSRELYFTLSMRTCGSSPHGPFARRPSQALCAPSLDPSHESPVPLKKLQMALRLRPLTFSGSKIKDPR
jgi:hypothetical protein